VNLVTDRLVHVATGAAWLEGQLAVPQGARGVVLFAHGSGSSRHSPRNLAVAKELRRHHLATLLVDLLTDDEAEDEERVFDVGLLAERLHAAVRFSAHAPETGDLPLGLFGASTGAAAALRVAAETPLAVSAVVSRGGRPDLAGRGTLKDVRAPTLLLVGALDHEVLRLNQAAVTLLHCEHALVIVPEATHLFMEPGALDTVALQAARWFTEHLPPTTSPSHAAA
jgi:putative phosphoribosyl transferase